MDLVAADDDTDQEEYVPQVVVSNNARPRYPQSQNGLGQRLLQEPGSYYPPHNHVALHGYVRRDYRDAQDNMNFGVYGQKGQPIDFSVGKRVCIWHS